MNRWLPGAGGAPDQPRIRPELLELERGLAPDIDVLPPESQHRELPLPYALIACAEELRSAAPAFARLPAEARIAGILRIARSWRDPDDPSRCALAADLEAQHGDTRSALAGVDDAMGAVTVEALRAAWKDEGGPPSGDLSAHVWPGNVFVAGLPPLWASLLAGMPALVKAPSSFPSFAARFAESVALHAPEFGPVVGAAAFSRADSASVALLRGITPRFTFGTQGAIDAFAGASAHGFGPRYSIAVMHPSASEADLRGLARDVLIWDGLGCLTPKWIFVPGSLPDATALARRMSPVLAEAAVLLPASASSRLDPAKAQWVGSAALQGFADAGAGWAVGAIPADTLVEPCPRAACFVALPDLASLPALLAPLGPRLQGIALPGAREPSTDAPASDTLRALPAPLRALLSLGLSYVAPPGRLQTPPLRWDHDDVRIQRACVR